ncbi:MAG: HlyD family efflux transporter periplasmic adaptor subunit [Acidobacteriota bacterium]
MRTSTDSPVAVPQRARRWLTALAFLPCCLLGLVGGCAERSAEAPIEDDARSWSITAWGETFEVFPEVDPLTVGETATAWTHVTLLEGFEPLPAGSVEVVLRGAGPEQVFAADVAERPGLFAVSITPARAGDFDLAIRLRHESGEEELRAGRVRVGEAGIPGHLLVAPAPKGSTTSAEPMTFLKEQQWQSPMATAWVRSGRLAGSVRGTATVRPPAGGEASLSATVDGVLRPVAGASWPHVGLAVDAGQGLFRVVPLVARERSLAELEGRVTARARELASARQRLARLEELLALEASSRREVETARVRVETLEAQGNAARRDLDAARGSRQGRGAGPEGAPSIVLRAPFRGVLAEVQAIPGATVSAGQVLARVVGNDLAWVAVELSPAGARRLAGEGLRGLLLEVPESPPWRITEGLRLVSIAPQVSPRTGTVQALLEAPRDRLPALGTVADARVLTATDRTGVVVPASALIDDGGIPVVYLQLAGESFLREPVEIVERQGDQVLVGGLVPGQRLVTAGGDALRRAALLAAGDSHGHVH